MSNPLYSLLIEAYEGINTKRSSASGSQTTLRIDDRSPQDRHADFCEIQIVLSNSDSDSFHLQLSPAPHNLAVRELVERYEGTLTEGRMGASIELDLRGNRGGIVQKLAGAIQKVTGRGQQYSDPNWKWICHRTADSLERFARILKDVNKQIHSQRKP